MAFNAAVSHRLDVVEFEAAVREGLRELGLAAQHPATRQPIRDRAVRRLIGRATGARPEARPRAQGAEGVAD